jgi:S1-C subfamily serine protease
MNLVILHLEGSKKDRTETFKKARLRVGRDPGNDIVFDPYVDRDASGFHAELFEEGGRLWMRDLGSTNGTYINGDRTVKREVKKGDVLGFGKQGPVIRIEEVGLLPAGEAPSPEAGEELADRGDFRNVGTRTMRLIVSDALGKARNKGGMAGGTLFFREMVRQTVKESSAKERRLVFFLAFLLVAAGGVIVFQIVRSAGKEQDFQRTIDDRDRRLAEQERQWFEKLQGTLRQRQIDFEKATEAERIRNEEMVRTWRDDLKKARTNAVQDRGKIARLERLLASIRDAESLFKKIQKKYDRSIVLIFTQFKVKTEGGGEKTIQGFGTGFVVSRDGHVITNKHVVQPWKFSQMLFRMKENRQEMVDGSAFHAVWLSGRKVYTLHGKTPELNFSTAYTSPGGGKLRIVKTAPDNMCWLARSGANHRVRKVWAHEPSDNNDLALLKITDNKVSFLPIPLMPERPFLKLEKLDRIMVLGFPRGGSILERGVAETSPSLGHIRKIERSVHISAPITQGNSGGPVFAQSGEVVGISTRMIKDVESYGFCIPVGEAKKLLSLGD